MAKNGTVAYVAKYPECDIHKYYYNVLGVEAHYDGRNDMHPSAWAHMCDECFNEFGHGVGLGIGQRLEIQQ